VPENFDPHALPFKVTQGQWNRHGSIGQYHFILVWPYLYRFRDRWQLFAKFPHPPVHLALPLTGFPWNFVTALGLEENRMMPYQNVQKCDDMSIRFDTVPALERERERERETDEHTDTFSR